MIAGLLRVVLPRHLDWLADVVADIVGLIEDGTEATRRGWTDADEAELADACAELARRLALGIRNAVQATEATRPRRRRFNRATSDRGPHAP